MHALPEQMRIICQTVDAPPRLIAHLTLVHDVAFQLLEELKRIWPELSLDTESVLFGAASHDIGKSIHRTELSETGNAHEKAGEKLLLSLGIAPERARFARTHAAWDYDKTLMLEDLIVALADTCWKGQRKTALETLVIDRIKLATGGAEWELFLALDDVLQKLTADADKRLAWQAQFPVS